MNKRIHKYFVSTLVIFFLCFCFSLTAKTETMPNVIVIYADDLGYGDIGCQGANKVQTPNIDKLALEGRRFTDAHSASAVCTPSRYALLTGEYPHRGNQGRGFWGPLSSRSQLIIDKNTLTLGKVFQNKGYETACFGKWHLGFGDKKDNDWTMPLTSGPNEVGFDYYWGVPLVNSSSPYVFVENNRVVGYDENDPLVYLTDLKAKVNALKSSPTMKFRGKAPNRYAGALKAHELYKDDQIGTIITEKAIDWITENKEKPFFLYFATTNIHHPFTPAKRFLGTSQAGVYGDFIHELDWMVGELVATLEKNKLSENTMIIFTSDNGGMFNYGGEDAIKKGHKINGDLLGFKFGVWEGGHRIPFIAKWQGHIPAHTVSDQLICSMDLLSAFVSLTKQENQLSLKGKDAKNILPALLGDVQTEVREELLLAPSKRTHLSFRKGDWVFIPAQGSGGFPGERGGAGAVSIAGGVNSDIVEGKISPTAPAEQLYNIKQDKNQTKNVYRQYPKVVEQMKKRLLQLSKEKS